MRELRAVLVMMPPLLADMVQQVLSDRFAASFPAEIDDIASAAARFGALSPDLVIAGSRSAALAFLEAAPGARGKILALSEDLTTLLRPDTGESAAFTSENLVVCAQKILQTI